MTNPIRMPQPHLANPSDCGLTGRENSQWQLLCRDLTGSFDNLEIGRQNFSHGI